MKLIRKIKLIALSSATISGGLATVSFLMSKNKTVETPPTAEKPKYPRRGYRGCLDFGTSKRVCEFLYPRKTWDWYK